MLLVHDATGETRRITSTGSILPSANVVSYTNVTVESEFTSAITGDLFYLRPDYTVNRWDMFWAIGAPVNGSSQDPANTFLGNAAAQYFSLQEWTPQLLALVALGVTVPVDSAMDSAIRLCIRANAANTPTAGQDFPTFIGDTVTSTYASTDWPSDFYTSHSATIFASYLAADVTAPVISGISSTAVSGGASTVTLTTDTAAGAVFWVVYASGGGTPSAAQILAGQNALGVAALKSGELDVTATGTVTVPVTGIAATNIIAILHQDFSNNNSNILTRTL
jgi:hypothetical protein